VNTKPKFIKNGRPDGIPKRPNIKSFDGGNLLVFVLRRKFQATAIPHSIGKGDGDHGLQEKAD